MSTVLVLDDQPVNRQFLKTLLGYFGHEILEAADGTEALELLQTRKVDLVIADVLMPTMDGYDFLQQLRRDRQIRPVAVIFYTAADYEAKAREMAEAHGVRHFLTKPAEPQDILIAVNSALGRSPAPICRDGLDKFDRHLLSPPADPIDPNAVVFVVEDDAAVRNSTAAIIQQAKLKVETFASGEDFLENYEPKQTNCLILDLHLPGISGMALLEKLRARRIDIPTIILTGHGDTSSAVEALRLHALDFLQKPTDPRILIAKIYRALQEDSIKRREHASAEAIRLRMAQLTLREKELVKMLVQGKSSKEIASELCISVKTVSNHRAHLMAKTRATNLADLVRMSMLSVDK